MEAEAGPERVCFSIRFRIILSEVATNVPCFGKFSSDRTIGEYAEHIWNAKPCPVR